MKNLKFLVLALFAGMVMGGCSNNADPGASSAVSLTMSASTANGLKTINGRMATDGRVSATTITLTGVTVNLREIEFEYDGQDEHFKKDSSFRDENETKLKGPFIVDLMNADGFVEQTITSVSVPNAKYEKVKFKLAPSTVLSASMSGKSISIKGKIGDKPFEFWHNANAKFGAKFNDSTAFAASGAAAKLAIHLEMDRILSAANGGVDLSTALDGNNDGTITIDPMNTDGNKNLADAIMILLMHRTHCEKKH